MNETHTQARAHTNEQHTYTVFAHKRTHAHRLKKPHYALHRQHKRITTLTHTHTHAHTHARTHARTHIHTQTHTHTHTHTHKHTHSPLAQPQTHSHTRQSSGLTHFTISVSFRGAGVETPGKYREPCARAEVPLSATLLRCVRAQMSVCSHHVTDRARHMRLADAVYLRRLVCHVTRTHARTAPRGGPGGAPRNSYDTPCAERHGSRGHVMRS
jgi:hypothetical protein